MAKKNINEGFFNTALKGIVGVYFGQKLIGQAASRKAMKDPEVKKAFAKTKDQLAKFDAIMKKKYGDNYDPDKHSIN